MSFDVIEARATASVFKTLANAQATYTAGGVTFPVVFDQAGGLVDEFGVATQQPSFTMQPASFSSLAEGMALVVRGVNFSVRSVVPLNEGGWQRVTLARA